MTHQPDQEAIIDFASQMFDALGRPMDRADVAHLVVAKQNGTDMGGAGQASKTRDIFAALVIGIACNAYTQEAQDARNFIETQSSAIIEALTTGDETPEEKDTLLAEVDAVLIRLAQDHEQRRKGS